MRPMSGSAEKDEPLGSGGLSLRMALEMKFYAYLWLREDGTPYYVGKGTGKRAFVQHSHNAPCPKDKDRIVVIPCATESEAFAREVELIDLYRRKDPGEGCLRNLTDGGEDPPRGCLKGRKLSEAHYEYPIE